MFERAPFKQCPNCREMGLGILSAGGDFLTRRCKSCRHTTTEPLPFVNKAVVYLDQFAVSEIFKTRSGTRRKDANSGEFWSVASEKLNTVLLLQQAVFPSGSVHTEESLVFASGGDLRLAHDLLGGDIDFISVEEIESRQAWAFFRSFVDGLPPPSLEFDVDRILHGERNGWLRDMHISVNTDYSHFAAKTRASRDAGGESLASLFRAWADEKPAFKAVLRRELDAYGRAKFQAASDAFRQVAAADEGEDMASYLDGVLNPHLREFFELREFLVRRGLAEEEAGAKVLEFWMWQGNDHQPYHRTSCYLFAALARKAASGQQRPPSRGTLNDIKAIAAYGPYVDAMFLDREWAGLLAEKPLNEDLPIKARIFSMSTQGAFLAYLDDLIAQADTQVRAYAREIYG